MLLICNSTLLFAGTTPLQKRLKKSSVPHIFPCTQEKTSSEMKRITSSVKRKLQAEKAEMDQCAWVQVGAEEVVIPDHASRYTYYYINITLCDT